MRYESIIYIAYHNKRQQKVAVPIVYTYSDLLCFASYAVNKIANKPLESLISDFYTQDAIASAKGMLLDYLDSQGERSELSLSQGGVTACLNKQWTWTIYSKYSRTLTNTTLPFPRSSHSHPTECRLYV